MSLSPIPDRHPPTRLHSLLSSPRQYVDREFQPALSASADPDARAVYTRIQTFLRGAQFAQPPEGRDMPQYDSSSYDRA